VCRRRCILVFSTVLICSLMRRKRSICRRSAAAALGGRGTPSGVRKASIFSAALRKDGLKLRTPTCARIAFIQLIVLVRSLSSELQSVRQVHRWLRQEGIALPNTAYGPQGRHVVWKLPIYMAVYGIMTNPIYAGAYAYGRSTHRIRLEQGRKRIVRGV